METFYVNENGETVSTTAQKLDDSITALTDDWYVVNGPVTLSTLEVTGANVNLILADGVTFTNQSELWLLSGSLNIWAQSTGDDQGKSSSGMGTASIRGNGDLTIHGGNITVTMPDPTDPNLPTGYTHCVGLGSGDLTVTGGTLTARITYWDHTTSPGDITAQTVTVSGGTVDADTLSGTFSTGENGHAILYVKTIEDTSNRANWDCIRFPPLRRTASCTAA